MSISINLLPSAVAAIGFAPETTSRSTVMPPIFFPAVLIISAPSAAREDSTLLEISPPFSISTSFSSASDQEVSLYPLYANPGELGAYLVDNSAYGRWQIIATRWSEHRASAIVKLERLTCSLVLVVEVEEDAAKLGIFAEVGDMCEGCCEFGQEYACVFLGDAAVLFTDGELVGIGEDDEYFSCGHGEGVVCWSEVLGAAVYIRPY